MSLIESLGVPQQSTTFTFTPPSMPDQTGEKEKGEKFFTPVSLFLLFGSWYECSVTVNAVD
jgi:hypothetical protein